MGTHICKQGGASSAFLEDHRLPVSGDVALTLCCGATTPAPPCGSLPCDGPALFSCLRGVWALEEQM